MMAQASLLSFFNKKAAKSGDSKANDDKVAALTAATTTAEEDEKPSAAETTVGKRRAQIQSSTDDEQDRTDETPIGSKKKAKVEETESPAAPSTSPSSTARKRQKLDTSPASSRKLGRRRRVRVIASDSEPDDETETPGAAATVAAVENEQPQQDDKEEEEDEKAQEPKEAKAPDAAKARKQVAVKTPRKKKPVTPKRKAAEPAKKKTKKEQKNDNSVAKKEDKQDTEETEVKEERMEIEPVPEKMPTPVKSSPPSSAGDTAQPTNTASDTAQPTSTASDTAQPTSTAAIKSPTSGSSASASSGIGSSLPMPEVKACPPKKRIPLSFFTPKTGSSQTATKAPSTAGSSTSSDSACVEPRLYNPAKDGYHPVNDACWSADSKSVPYMALARTLCLIEATSARLKIASILCNFFRSVIALAPDQLLPCVYLCLNELGPAHEGLELGIGESIVMKAITMATGRSLPALKSQMVELGDLGLLAEKSRGKQSMMYVPAALTIKKVFSHLKEIAQMAGNKSQQKKIEKINSLLVAGRDCEPRYIARSLTGKLRIGLAEQTLLMALAHAVVYTPPSTESPPPVLDGSKGVSAEKFKARLDEATLTVKSTQSELPNYDNIVPALLEHGVAALPEHCRMTPGIPLKPMLAHPTKEISEVLRRFDGCDFTCEYKYDGERAQIHLLDTGKVHIYSRNRENNTSKFPDIIARIPRMVKEGVTSFVIDTEAVAWDCEKKEIQPFQVLSTRKRKDADASEIKVQVCTFAFDLLYLNGKSYVKEPFSVRRQALHDSFNTVEGEFVFVTQRDCTDTEQIEEFLDMSIQGNCEGLMVKTLDVDATYEIAKRSHNWLKVKKDYLEGMGDSLDLVVLGGYHGAGKRQGVFGAFLLACYNTDSEQYETVCKIGTGLKDEELQKHTKFFNEHVLGGPKSYYSHGSGAQQPDVWFDAVQVWEVKAADFTISPVYTAGSGLVDAAKGISMRFPRVIRIRDDKKAEEATSSEQMADMYRSQQNKKSSHGTRAADDDEFY